MNTMITSKTLQDPFKMSCSTNL